MPIEIDAKKVKIEGTYYHEDGSLLGKVLFEENYVVSGAMANGNPLTKAFLKDYGLMLKPAKSGKVQYFDPNKKYFEGVDLSQLWADKPYIANAPTDKDLKRIKDKFGFKLPASYVWLLSQHNGGVG
ncbi:MAG: SMI1/KNR4 family protein [Deferribacteraceae bacterium]|jgi:hypothetical protein|nr:SMI1/KNR4 family protein [Deferribacteraceae bacterium]